VLFWSIKQQKIMHELEMNEVKQVKNGVAVKFPIRRFGEKSDKIRTIFPDSKVVVFADEAWKLSGT